MNKIIERIITTIYSLTRLVSTEELFGRRLFQTEARSSGLSQVRSKHRTRDLDECSSCCFFFSKMAGGLVA